MNNYPTNLRNEKEQWLSFRQSLFSLFPRRKDAIIDLIDSLSGNQNASSAVQVSENDLFTRNYHSLYKAINQSFDHDNEAKKIQNSQKHQLIFSTLDKSSNQPFNLFGLDATSIARQYAKTLSDRSFVYQPSTIKGNKPVTIGHKYSVLSCLIYDQETDYNWAIPLDSQRINSQSKDAELGCEQIQAIFDDCSQLNPDKLSVLVADSLYSNKGFLSPNQHYDNLVIISRVRSNRVFYQLPPKDKNNQTKRGHPTWYGQRFSLKDNTTWHEVDEEFSQLTTNKKGEIIKLNIKSWNNMIMKGDKNHKMHEFPFRLLQISLTDEKGVLRIKPMWLIVIGKRKQELTLFDCYQSYCRRFDMEHLFRFAKNKLLLNNYSTPNIEQEEKWVELVCLSYVNLWAARNLAVNIPYDWEKYYQKKTPSKITPSMVQKDFNRIIRTFGSGTVSPKLRGYSSGRKKGTKMTPRKQYPVVKKTSTKKKVA